MVPQANTPALGRTANAMEKGATEIGVELSVARGERVGSSPKGVKPSSTPFSNTLWLCKFCAGAVMWYSSRVGVDGVCTLAIEKKIPSLLALTSCSLLLVKVPAVMPTFTFTVVLERLISSTVTPPCTTPQCLKKKLTWTLAQNLITRVNKDEGFRVYWSLQIILGNFSLELEPL